MSRQYTYTADGWTILPAPAGRIICVDPVAGNDSSAAGNASSPLKTLAAAYRKAGDGGAILLKRGTTITENPWGAFHWVNFTLSYYGDALLPRPMWNLDYSKPGGVIHLNGQGMSMVGIDVRQLNHVQSGPGFNPKAAAGAGLVVGGADVLIEDCAWNGFFQGVNVIGPDSTTIRRCQGINCFTSTSGHSAGIYTDGCTNLVLDEVVLAGNGWNLSDPADNGNEFSHGGYFDDDKRPFAGVSITNSLFANNGGCGAEVRPGGLVTGCLFVNASCNGMDIIIGGVSPLTTQSVFTNSVDCPRPAIGRGNALGFGGVTGIASANVFIGSATTRLGALTVAAVTSNGLDYSTGTTTLISNVAVNWNGQGIRTEVAHGTIASQDNTLSVTGPVVEIVAFPTYWQPQGNVHQTLKSVTPVYHIAGVDITAAQWAKASGETAGFTAATMVDPARTIERYINEVVAPVVKGMDGTFATFLKAVCSTYRGNCPEVLRVPNVVKWLQAGFQPKVPVATPAGQITSKPVKLVWPLPAK